MADSKADAPFVFEGSVKSLSASNVAAVPADDKTVIVQVDHVRHAPRALAGFAGKEITVRLAPNEKIALDEQAIFFTDSLVFGEQLAVQSMGHDPVIAVEERAALAGASPVMSKLRRRVDAAQAVVTGKVAEVREAPTVRATSALETAAAPERISEHAPFWNEAVIDVSSVHKGPRQKNVVVRFPSSTDVRWRNAPKFKKGQKGTWLLHAPPAPATAARATESSMIAAAPAGVYTALDPNDFHPASESAALNAMLPAVPPAGGTPAVTAKKTAAKKAAPKKAAGKKSAVKKSPSKKAAAKKPAAKSPAKKRR